MIPVSYGPAEDCLDLKTVPTFSLSLVGFRMILSSA